MKPMNLRFGALPPRHVRRTWIGGFNLLPYRQREARRGRQRRVAEWLAAAAAGCVAVLALAAWQTVERAQRDAHRASLEQSLAQMVGPLAEHQRLSRDEEDERLRAARALTLSEPYVHLLALFDALSRESDESVVVQQLRQRDHETELLAVSRDHAAPAVWLKRLSAVRGVSESEVSDLHRAANPTHGMSPNESSAIEFSARLHWDGARDKAARTAASAGAPPVHAGNKRGTK